MNSSLSSALPHPGLIDPKLFGVVPASRLQRPAVPLVSSGVTEIDELAGGFPRGALTEIYGPASSGRSSVLLAALAAATQREEICALVDSTDSFDPYSGAATGIDLERLLWIRCGQAGTGTSSQQLIAGSRNAWMQRLEQVLKVTDLLLQGGGFGMVAVDLADVPPEFVRRVPLASWFRFCRTIERTPTMLLVVEREAHAKSCAALGLKTNIGQYPAIALTIPEAEDRPANGQLFCGVSVKFEITRARMNLKKPVKSVASDVQYKSLSVGTAH